MNEVARLKEALKKKTKLAYSVCYQFICFAAFREAGGWGGRCAPPRASCSRSEVSHGQRLRTIFIEGINEIFSLKKEEMICCTHLYMCYILGGMRDIQKDLVFLYSLGACGLVLSLYTVLRNDKAGEVLLTPLSNARTPRRLEYTRFSRYPHCTIKIQPKCHYAQMEF